MGGISRPLSSVVSSSNDFSFLRIFNKDLVDDPRDKLILSYQFLPKLQLNFFSKVLKWVFFCPSISEPINTLQAVNPVRECEKLANNFSYSKM